MHAFGLGLAALERLPDLLRYLEWHPDARRAAIDPSLDATDLATWPGKACRFALRIDSPLIRSAGLRTTPMPAWPHAIHPGAAADMPIAELQRRFAAFG